MYPLLYLITLINGLENIPATTKQRYTNFWADVLHQACRYNDYNKAKLALLAGADINKKHKYFIFPNHYEEPPLTTTIKNYMMYRHQPQDAQISENIMQLLLDGDASINQTDGYGRNALHTLLYDYTHYTHWIMKLLPMSDVTIKDNWNGTILNTAIDHNHDIETIKAIISKGADLRAQGFSGNTPMHVALNKVPFSSELIQLLLPNINPAMQNGMGETIFHKTAQRHPTALNYLISIMPLKSLIEIPSENIEFIKEPVTNHKKRSIKNSLRSIVLRYILQHYEHFEKDLNKLPEDLRNKLHHQQGIIYNYDKAIEGLKYLLSLQDNWQQPAYYFLRNNESEYKKFHPDHVEENFGPMIKRRIKEEFYRSKELKKNL